MVKIQKTKADMNFLKNYLKIFTQIFFYKYIKKNYRQKYKKKICVLNINMTNISLDELKLVAKNRNIRDYENKSEDLIKAISESKPKIRIDKRR